MSGRKTIVIGSTILLVAISFYSGASLSQTNTAGSVTGGINLAPIVNSGINLLFAVILGFATHYINGHIRDHQLATQLSNAVENAMGTVQQYATDSVTAGNLRLPVNSVPIQKGVEYVLANAKEALDRWPDARDRIGQKLEAKVGVVAIRAGASVPGVSGPLAPVPATRDPQRRG
jgi:hypothetical protein